MSETGQGQRRTPNFLLGGGLLFQAFFRINDFLARWPRVFGIGPIVSLAHAIAPARVARTGEPERRSGELG